MNSKLKNTYRVSIENYLKEIDQFPLLTEKQEEELGLRIQEKDEQAVEELIRANLRFVVSVAKEYQNRGLPLEDLINEGNLGLIRAAHSFDPLKQTKFITYAVWWIRQKIMDAIIKHANNVRLPYNKAWDMMKVKKTRNKLQKELGRDPSLADLSDKIGVKMAKFAKDLPNFGKDLSLEDLVFGEEGSELKNRIENSETKLPDESVLKESLNIEIKRVLNSLPKKQGAILNLYFGIDGNKPLNLTEIGDQLNLSRERIRQLKEIALQKIRKTSKGKLLRQYLG